VTSKAFVGKMYLAVGNGASPETYTRYCEVDTISGIGVKNALVDVTTFCSGGSMEYIGGLADGKEVTFDANYVMSETLQEGLIADVEDKVTRNFELQIDGSSPYKTFKFAMAMIDYEIDPSVTKQNKIKFVGKISGAITRT
jgi:hypothetical protein